jgi:hypothetical protein
MPRHKVHRIGHATPDREIGRRVLGEIKALEGADIATLKLKWRAVLGREAPRFAKRSLLTQVLAWELQAKAYGGLKPALHRHLLALAEGENGGTGKMMKLIVRLKPGVKLVRSWHGEVHEVTVTEVGLRWRGQTFASLSRIAREITGTRWSGPLFFGLRKGGSGGHLQPVDTAASLSKSGQSDG